MRLFAPPSPPVKHTGIFGMSADFDALNGMTSNDSGQHIECVSFQGVMVWCKRVPLSWQRAPSGSRGPS